jgi:hypothetical protein
MPLLDGLRKDVKLGFYCIFNVLVIVHICLLSFLCLSVITRIYGRYLLDQETSIFA